MELKLEITVLLNQNQLIEKHQRSDILLATLGSICEDELTDILGRSGLSNTVIIHSSVIPSQGERQ